MKWHRAFFGPALEEYHQNDEIEDESPKSNRTLTMIKSRGKGPKWMISVGGSQEDVDMLQFVNKKFKPKSIQLDFTQHSEVAVPLILYDPVPNLDALMSVNKMNYSRLKEKIEERTNLDHVLIEACASETPDNDLLMTTVWSENTMLESKTILLTDESETENNEELDEILTEGFMPVSICGFKQKNVSSSHYLIVFVKPQKFSETPSSLARIKIGQSLKNFLEEDQLMTKHGMSVQRLHVHMAEDGKLKCAAIYLPSNPQQLSSSTPDHFINSGSDLRKLYSQAKHKRRGHEFVPKSVSRIQMNEDGDEEFVVLWKRGQPIWDLPPPTPARIPDQPIPVQRLVNSRLKVSHQIQRFVNRQIIDFMQRFDIPGLSVGISKDEELKLASGYGYANLKTKEKLTSKHKFRIASISKVVTATGIAMLIDEEKLLIDEKVFGKKSIFGDKFATDGAWHNSENDPVFLSELNESTDDLIRKTLHNSPPKERPGKRFAYSNFGYLLLGRIIEERSNLSYVDFVNQRLFEPSGLPPQSLMKRGLNADGGVLYYSTPEVSDDPYELPDPLNLAACCGWEMSPTDLLTFLSHADGFISEPDLISTEMFALMGTPTKQSNNTYGLGWSVDKREFEGRTHQGQMPASLSLLVRTDSGVELVLTMNKFPPKVIAIPALSLLAQSLVSSFENVETESIENYESEEA
ncbi:Serine beta-lactamase-like protein LACTB, mitochondrial [Aphelenchoides bicaudatus]|nr:Serine beta-lactamase-like protein LACTB, mitochondrial [Aphelenchoides bicaudatus]